MIGHNAVMVTLNHGIKPNERKNMIPSPITVGKNVWIRANATILAGVTIGDRRSCNKDVPANTIVGGVPAKIIKTIEE